ncbi:MAG: hypothetical protein D6681_19370, partial [Calditrichaeota bacterium]
MHRIAAFSSKETPTFLVGNDSFPEKKKIFPYRKIFFFLPGVILVFLAARTLGHAWDINAWSLAFARPALTQGLENAAVPHPPVAHRRAAIWFARQALAAEDGPQQTQPWLAALQAAASEDVLAARTLGQVLWAQGRTMKAVQTWVRIGDYLALLNAGQQAQDDGKLDDAYIAYWNARAVDMVAGTMPLVNFFWVQRDYSAAETMLRETLQCFPNAPPKPIWLRKLGDTLRAQKRWDEAEQVYLRLLRETTYTWQA